MNPIQVFIKRPVFTTMLLLSLVVFGIYSYPRIGVDSMPNVDFPVVVVTVIHPGADPESMERNVAEPLEEAINTISGLDQLRSISVDSVTQIIARFDLDKNPDVAAQEVRDKVQSQIANLPDDIETPIIDKFDINAVPIAYLALSGPVPIEELTRIAEDVVKPLLQQQNGVGQVQVQGGRKREIRVEVDPERLRSYGLSVSEVVTALAAQNIDIPGGRTKEPGRERTVKLASQAQSVDEIRDIVIPAPTPSPVRVRDVANVIDGPEEARSIASFRGQSAVSLVVQKQSGANTTAVAEAVIGSLGRIQSQLPEGVKLEVVYDGSRFIRASIAAVEEDLLVGGILAVLVVLLFLRNVRSTLVAAVALPTSVIGTFAFMKALDFTFNNVTMLALTLSIGLLIDDAIVVIENIVRHLEEGKSPMRAAYDGTREIALAVFAITLSLVAVFVPVAIMEGIIGRFFFQFGITVAVAVLISFAVSLSLTPMMSARVLKEEKPGKVSQAIERVFLQVENLYRRMLRWMLDHRGVVVAGAVGLLVATLAVGSLLKTTFIPSMDQASFRISVELPVGSDLDSTWSVVENLASQVDTLPGVASVYASAGGGVQEQVHKGELVINLVPISQRTFRQQDFKDFIRERLVVPEGVIVSVTDFQAVGGGAAQEIQFNLRGPSWEEVIASSEKVLAAMREHGGFVDIDTSYRPGKPELAVVLDRDRAAALGIPAASLGQTLRAYLGGDKISDYREGGETYEVRIRLPENVLADAASLGKLPIRAGNGELVELRNVARIEERSGPTQIDRQSLLRQITIYANMRQGVSLGEGMAFLQEFAQRELPPSIITGFDGAGGEMGEAMTNFVAALILGVVLVYMVLAAQFESLVHPFVIMMALPFAIIGAFVALLVTGEYFSLFAMIGLIMLMGLVTKNGILLVEFANQLKAQGLSTREALEKAGPLRLRPILMTTFAMIGGMIPPALASGDGAELRNGMAVAIIGGLISSTFLTLGVVPVVYSLVDQFTAWLRRKLGREAPASAEELAA